MDALHFGIRSGKRGTASTHLAYVTRKGRYAKRGDLIATGYGNMPSWAQDDPNLLWKASDTFERKNGSAFRSLIISLPNVLTIEQLTELARDEAHRLAGNKPFQFALHLPTSSLEKEPNPHVHIVICDRLPDGIERGPEQMFRRYNAQQPERGGCRKDTGGLPPGELQVRMRAMREAVANNINRTLERHGHDLRIEHRSHKELGIERPPERYLGPTKIRLMSDAARATYIQKRRLRRGDDTPEPKLAIQA